MVLIVGLCHALLCGFGVWLIVVVFGFGFKVLLFVSLGFELLM